MILQTNENHLYTEQLNQVLLTQNKSLTVNIDKYMCTSYILVPIVLYYNSNMSIEFVFDNFSYMLTIQRNLVGSYTPTYITTDGFYIKISNNVKDTQISIISDTVETVVNTFDILTYGNIRSINISVSSGAAYVKSLRIKKYFDVITNGQITSQLFRPTISFNTQTYKYARILLNTLFEYTNIRNVIQTSATTYNTIITFVTSDNKKIIANIKVSNNNVQVIIDNVQTTCGTVLSNTLPIEVKYINGSTLVLVNSIQVYNNLQRVKMYDVAIDTTQSVTLLIERLYNTFDIETTSYIISLQDSVSVYNTTLASNVDVTKYEHGDVLVAFKIRNISNTNNSLTIGLALNGKPSSLKIDIYFRNNKFDIYTNSKFVYSINSSLEQYAFSVVYYNDIIKLNVISTANEKMEFDIAKIDTILKANMYVAKETQQAVLIVYNNLTKSLQHSNLFDLNTISVNATLMPANSKLIALETDAANILVPDVFVYSTTSSTVTPTGLNLQAIDSNTYKLTANTVAQFTLTNTNLLTQYMRFTISQPVATNTISINYSYTNELSTQSNATYTLTITKSSNITTFVGSKTYQVGYQTTQYTIYVQTTNKLLIILVFDLSNNVMFVDYILISNANAVNIPNITATLEKDSTISVMTTKTNTNKNLIITTGRYTYLVSNIEGGLILLYDNSKWYAGNLNLSAGTRNIITCVINNRSVSCYANGTLKTSFATLNKISDIGNLQVLANTFGSFIFVLPAYNKTSKQSSVQYISNIMSAISSTAYCANFIKSLLMNNTINNASIFFTSNFGTSLFDTHIASLNKISNDIQTIINSSSQSSNNNSLTIALLLNVFIDNVATLLALLYNQNNFCKQITLLNNIVNNLQATINSANRLSNDNSLTIALLLQNLSINNAITLLALLYNQSNLGKQVTSLNNIINNLQTTINSSNQLSNNNGLVIALLLQNQSVNNVVSVATLSYGQNNYGTNVVSLNNLLSQLQSNVFAANSITTQFLAALLSLQLITSQYTNLLKSLITESRQCLAYIVSSNAITQLNLTDIISKDTFDINPDNIYYYSTFSKQDNVLTIRSDLRPHLELKSIALDMLSENLYKHYNAGSFDEFETNAVITDIHVSNPANVSQYRLLVSDEGYRGKCLEIYIETTLSGGSTIKLKPLVFTNSSNYISMQFKYKTTANASQISIDNSGIYVNGTNVSNVRKYLIDREWTLVYIDAYVSTTNTQVTASVNIDVQLNTKLFIYIDEIQVEEHVNCSSYILPDLLTNNKMLVRTSNTMFNINKKDLALGQVNAIINGLANKVYKFTNHFISFFFYPNISDFIASKLSYDFVILSNNLALQLNNIFDFLVIYKFNSNEKKVILKTVGTSNIETIEYSLNNNYDDFIMISVARYLYYSLNKFNIDTIFYVNGQAVGNITSSVSGDLNVTYDDGLYFAPIKNAYKINTLISGVFVGKYLLNNNMPLLNARGIIWTNAKVKKLYDLKTI